MFIPAGRPADRLVLSKRPRTGYGNYRHIYLSVYLSIYQSIYLSIYLCVYMYTKREMYPGWWSR